MWKKRLIILAFCLAVAFALKARAASFPPHPKPAQVAPRILAPKDIFSLPAEAACDVFLTPAGLARVVSQQTHSVIIKLNKPGKLHIRYCSHQQDLWVVPAPIRHQAQQLQQLIHSFLGLTLSYENQTFTVSGQLHRLSDWQAIAQLKFTDHFVLAAQLDQDVQARAESFFRRQFVEQGLGSPQMIWSAPPVFTFSSATKNQDKMISEFLAPYGIRWRYSPQRFDRQPLLQVAIVFAEVDKQMQKTFGLNWPEEYQAQLLPHASWPTSLQATLKMMQQKGQAHVLASPTLVCRSGADAQFLAGGEFAIRQHSYRSHHVEWKQHGILLKIHPQIDVDRVIRLKLETEISRLDMSQAVDGIPALKETHLSSEFDLQDGQTIVLSGLIKHIDGDSQEGVPGLSQIPLLGELFRSKNFLQNKTELVVFVTPKELKDQK